MDNLQKTAQNTAKRTKEKKENSNPQRYPALPAGGCTKRGQRWPKKGVFSTASVNG